MAISGSTSLSKTIENTGNIVNTVAYLCVWGCMCVCECVYLSMCRYVCVFIFILNIIKIIFTHIEMHK